MLGLRDENHIVGKPQFSQIPDFTVHVDDGPSYTFKLPLADNDPQEFYDILYAYIRAQFSEAIERYDRGTDARSIGFDFSEADDG